MAQKLPTFTYHPSPLATGMIKPSSAACACCGEARGYIYDGPAYAIEELLESLCPWCISSGLAAKKFDASFVDDRPLQDAGLPAEVIEEVVFRTPGYTSWQQDSWLSHCNDACEFHGDASADDVAFASEETKLAWQREYRLNAEDWSHATEDYRQAGESAFYKFICRHCGLVLMGWDCS
jgi:uncharacterized protein CbrC (UPF0167 family)